MTHYLVFNLCRNRGNFLLLALHSLRQLSVDPLEVRDGLLGELEVALHLPLHLLHVALGLLLALQSILALVEGLLELALHLAQVVAPVLSSLDVLLSLLPPLTGRLLLLAQLDDHVLLVGDLVAQSSDLGVLGVLVLLTPPHRGLQILDLMTQLLSFSGNLEVKLKMEEQGNAS